MKRLRLIVSDAAREDLNQVFDYIQADNPTAAEKFLNQIEASLSTLSSFPSRGKLARDESLRARDYRILVIGEYLAFYRIQGSAVNIIRVIHGRRHYTFLL